MAPARDVKFFWPLKLNAIGSANMSVDKNPSFALYKRVLSFKVEANDFFLAVFFFFEKRLLPALLKFAPI